MKLPVPDYIRSVKPYEPGKPLEELERECGITDSIKIASNENPLGPSPLAVRAIRQAVTGLHRYPDGSGYVLIGKIARKMGVLPANVVLGNGSDEIIGMLTRAFLQPGDEAILPQPSFLMYEIMVRSCGATPVFVPLKNLGLDLEAMRGRITPATRMIFICNPNNPTGTILTRTDFQAFVDGLPEQVVTVVDEAYIEFVRAADCARGVDYMSADHPVVTLRTFSKAYGLAGLRIGYGLMAPEVSELLNRIRLPFNASSLAQAGAGAALDDEGFFQETLRVVHEGLDFLYKALDRLGVAYFRTQANFFLIDVRTDADRIFQLLLREGVIVRSMTSYGYPEYIRINAGLPEENERFVRALEKVMR